MKTILVTILFGLCVLTVQGLAAKEGGKAASKVFRAGAATSNITPFLGTALIGGFSPKGSLYIHDELHVRCLVLDDGNTRLAFAIVDNVQIPYDGITLLLYLNQSIEVKLMLPDFGEISSDHGARRAPFPNIHGSPGCGCL